MGLPISQVYSSIIATGSMLFEKSLTPESNSEKKGKSKGWRMGAPIPKSKGEAYGNGVVGVNPAKALYLIPSTPDFTPSFAEELSTQRRSIFKGQSRGIGSGNIRRLSKVKQSSVRSSYETSYLRQSHIFIIISLSVSTIGRECPYTFNI